MRRAVLAFAVALALPSAAPDFPSDPSNAGTTSSTFVTTLPPLAGDRCFPARYTEPCTMSAWELDTPEGKIVALVRGPGSPTHLSRAVLLADNAFVICGAMTAPVEDGECGTTPVFTASHFRAVAPVQQLVDCDLEGLMDDCWHGGKPIVMPVRDLAEQDYEGVRLEHDGDDLRFVPR